VSTASNGLKTGLFSLFVPAVVAGAIPQAMVSKSQAAITSILSLRWIGVLMIAPGAVGYLWCAVLFVHAGGTPAPVFSTERTVVEGPYRVNRNPMYTSVLAVIFGQAVLWGNWRLAIYGVAVAVFVHLFVVFYEEPTLRRQFGRPYEDFCRRVPRWIPSSRR
jgi:protein-S-isoprenylcysteine O-methyltransferase Ste14